MKKYKTVVIGCGAIGALFETDQTRPKPATHAGAARAHPGTHLAALVDVDSEKLTAAARLFPKVPTYTDLQVCLKEVQPDIVIIATPPSMHVPLIRSCLSAGVKAIICEKPLADTYAHARAIAQLVNQKKVIFVLNYQRRFFLQFERARTAIARGRIGRVTQVSGYYSNGVRGNASHLIDALAFLLDDPIEQVVAIKNPSRVINPTQDQNLDALMHTKQGVTITLQGVDQSKWGVSELRVYGEKGALILNEYGYTLSYVPLQKSPFSGVKTLAYQKATSRTEKVSMVGGALDETVRCLTNRDKKPRSTASSGLYVEAVLRALEKSALHGGKTVSVSL